MDRHEIITKYLRDTSNGAYVFGVVVGFALGVRLGHKPSGPACEGCRKPLELSNKDRKYCGRACQQRAYRARQKDQASQPTATAGQAA